MKHLFCSLFIAALPLAMFAQKQSFSSLVKEGDVCASTGNYIEAIRLYRKAYEKKKDPELILKIGDAQYKNTNYPAALDCYAAYFNDTIYKEVPQFANYAKCAHLTGNLRLAVKLHWKLFQHTAANEAREYHEMYTYFLDSTALLRSYDLDSNYNCVELDGTSSVDTLAAPVTYIWVFGEEDMAEGLKVQHCFTYGGVHNVMLSVRDRATGVLRKNDTVLAVLTNDPLVKFSRPGETKKYFYTTLDASATEVPYHVIEYIWEPGNGDFAVGKKVRYRYVESGDVILKCTLLAHKPGGGYLLISSCRRLHVEENYTMPSKKFTDQLNESK